MRGFETARLRMRPLDAGDEALYCGLYTDAETMRYICEPLSTSRARSSFRRAIRTPRPGDGPLLFAMHEKGTTRSVGICAMVQLIKSAARAEVGVMLQSDARGRGYAREGLAGMVGSVFTTFAVQTIWVECAALNPIVERMVSSIGFVLDDATSIGEGPLLQRTWSVQRLSYGE